CDLPRLVDVEHDASEPGILLRQDERRPEHRRRPWPRALAAGDREQAGRDDRDLDLARELRAGERLGERDDAVEAAPLGRLRPLERTGAFRVRLETQEMHDAV